MYTYLLRCMDGSLYCGYTTDIDRRMKAHKEGKGAKYVKARGFKKLEVYIETESKSSAMKLEAAIKKISREKKEKIVRGELEIIDNLNIEYSDVVFPDK